MIYKRNIYTFFFTMVAASLNANALPELYCKNIDPTDIRLKIDCLQQENPAATSKEFFLIGKTIRNENEMDFLYAAEAAGQVAAKQKNFDELFGYCSKKDEIKQVFCLRAFGAAVDALENGWTHRGHVDEIKNETELKKIIEKLKPICKSFSKSKYESVKYEVKMDCNSTVEILKFPPSTASELKNMLQ